MNPSIQNLIEVVRVVKKPLDCIAGLPGAVKAAGADSYYPESSRKPFPARLADNLSWLVKYQEANRFYTLYGLDLKGADPSGFIDYRSFAQQRNDRNKTYSVGSQACILRDKLLFFEFMRFNGIPVPAVYAVIEHGKIFDLQHQPADISALTDYFVKERDGECASFVKHVKDADELTALLPSLNSKYIVQQAVRQCAEMNALNPGAINTLRIVTVTGREGPCVLSSVLRVGSRRTGSVDNWAAGGLSVGVESDGRLRPWGYYKPGLGTKADRHPDTGIVFSEFTVPEYSEAAALCVRAHKLLDGIHSIGWDVALPEDGPVLIEGNDNWEITLMQACDRPLKESWGNSL